MLLNRSSSYNGVKDGVLVWDLTSSGLSLRKDSDDLASHGKDFLVINIFRV